MENPNDQTPPPADGPKGETTPETPNSSASDASAGPQDSEPSAASESIPATHLPQAVEIPANALPERTWEELGLSEEMLNVIREAGFSRPTPVQGQAIPVALTGQDLVATAQTGTGKTATFVIPMTERFAGRQGTFGVILSPTREIALQTQATVERLGGPRGVRSVCLIGGVNMRQDDDGLATYPQIIVATPGRLCDHLDRGNLWLDFIEMVVLDEADRMLDMGFSTQLNRIMEDVPKSRQTLLFSATMPGSVESLAAKIMYDPARVAIGRPNTAAKTVEQRLIWMDESDKSRALQRLLKEETGTVIVFSRSKEGASRIWRSLHSAGFYEATYIHSDRKQADRELALEEFKAGKYRVLIATDVAGRGIHVDDVAHVINYDLSMEPEDYVHRIGRTGRKNASGRATTFATPRDRGMIKRIEKLLGRPIEVIDAPRSRSRPENRPASATSPDSAPESAPHSRVEPRAEKAVSPRGEAGRGGDRSSRRDRDRATPAGLSISPPKSAPRPRESGREEWPFVFEGRRTKPIFPVDELPVGFHRRPRAAVPGSLGHTLHLTDAGEGESASGEPSSRDDSPDASDATGGEGSEGGDSSRGRHRRRRRRGNRSRRESSPST